MGRVREHVMLRKWSLEWNGTGSRVQMCFATGRWDEMGRVRERFMCCDLSMQWNGTGSRTCHVLQLVNEMEWDGFANMPCFYRVLTTRVFEC